MKCRNCLQELKPNAVFCPNCGTKAASVDVYTPYTEIITVGRAPENNIRVESDGVSSYHAKIYINNNEVLIEDLNSTNGTYVNNTKVSKTVLKPGSVVYLGSNYHLDLNNVPAIKNMFSTGVQQQVNRTNIEPVSYNAETYQVSQNQQYQPYPVQQQQPYPVQQQSQQVNVNIYTKPKSVGIALLLSFLFGPLGMLYSTVTGGLIMLGVSLILGFFTFGFSVFVTHPVCVIWAAVAADNENKRVMISSQSINRTY